MPGPSRRSSVSPFIAMDVLVHANQMEAAGLSVIHMEIGQPCAPAPQRVREAAQAALAAGRIGYTQALGLPSLRERIASHYASHYGVKVPASRIAVTTGSSGAFILGFLAMFDGGDRVAIAAPCYPAYRNSLTALGLVPVPIETSAADRWVLSAKALEDAHREAPLAGVLVMSPGNPTGTMMSPEALRELGDACRRLDIWFMSDEIYHGLSWDMPEATALASHPDAVVINSFSKYYCMTGWRVGWMVLPESLMRPVERLAQSLFISVPTLSQIAAEAAFDATDELESIKAGYAENRAMLLKGLPQIGLSDFCPVDGAFYVYADIGRFTNDSPSFCARLLAETGVAATPGVDFDPERGTRTMRLSFAGTRQNTQQAIERLGAFLRGV